MSLEAAVGWFHVKDDRGAVGGERLERGDHRANLGVGGGAPPAFTFVRHVADHAGESSLIDRPIKPDTHSIAASNLVDRELPDGAPLIKHHDGVGEAFGLRELVRRNDDDRT